MTPEERRARFEAAVAESERVFAETFRKLAAREVHCGRCRAEMREAASGYECPACGHALALGC